MFISLPHSYIIKTWASFWQRQFLLSPHWSPMPSGTSALGSRASWPSAPAGYSCGQVSGVSGASLILFLLSFGCWGSFPKEPEKGKVRDSADDITNSQRISVCNMWGHGKDSKEEQQNLILLPTYVPYSFLTETLWGREMVSLQFTVEGSHTGTE